MNRLKIGISDVYPNEGQVEGLPANPRLIKKEKVEQLKKSIQDLPEMTEARDLLVYPHNGKYIVIGGNMRLRAYRELGWKEVPCCILPEDIPVEKLREIVIQDNNPFGETDWNMIANEWDVEELKDWGMDFPAEWYYSEKEKCEESEEVSAKKLSDRYIVPPFSILDTRQGYWKERKKIWNELIGDDGCTRDNADNRINVSSENWDNKPYHGGKIKEQNVSILDPVMAEIVCEWYGIDKGKSFDVFAGDTVFGYVSSSKGMSFTGIELREEQAEINNKRTKYLTAKYICDDGRNVLSHIEEESQDLLFSCPPYYNLEVYSNDERDASNQQSYGDFIKIIEEAFSNAIKCLKDNRFAVVVVGDIRNEKDGSYYCYQDDIKMIFRANGMKLYNEIILIQPIGNAALRANRYMKNRKTVKVHEYVLVFYKGDTSNIKDNFKTIEYASEDMEQFTMGE